MSTADSGAASSDEAEFLKAFFICCDHLGSAEKDNSVFAGEALRALFRAYVPQAKFSPPATPYFADHGVRHGVSLANFLARLSRELPVRKTAGRFCAFRSLECLVLTFASILMHDIGMSMPSPSDSSL